MFSSAAAWACLYLGTGLAVLLTVQLLDNVKRGINFLDALPRSVKAMSEAIAVILMVLPVWPMPILIGLSFKIGLVTKLSQFANWLISQNEYLSTRRTVKSCKLIGAYIHQITTVEAAEQSERPTDPLNRTPDVPFGHLNPGWKAFLLKHQNGWKLWTYEMPGLAPDQTGIDPPEPSAYQGRRLGYAWVSRQGVEAEFFYEWN